MLRCPDCDLPLQTLDHPCPLCAATDEEELVEDLAVHRFSKSFTTRWAFRPDPEGFVRELNRWLDAQPGLRWVEPRLHCAMDGVVGATLLCTASLEPAPFVLRFDRVSLVRGTLVPQRVLDLGTAIDDWRDRHVDAQVTWDQVLESNGMPTELWVLAAYERRSAPPIVDPPERTRFMGVQRLIAPLLLPLFALFFLGSVTSDPVTPLTERAVLGAVTAGLAWSAVRFPVWRR